MIINNTYPFINIVASLYAPNFMQVTSVNNGVLSNGLMVGGLNVPANMFITGQVNGLPGGPGLYTIGVYGTVSVGNTYFPSPASLGSPNATLASQPMLVAPWTVNVEETIISQYANSPTLLALLNNINQYIDPQANLFNFYNQVWNVNTAIGYGLDLWGRIVGVSRLIPTSQAPNFFNFATSLIGTEFGPGGSAPFLNGSFSTSILKLPDPIYRTVILAKALANISICSAPTVNRILTLLFGTGVSVIDQGAMTAQISVTGNLNATQLAILNFSGVVPRPSGVTYTVGAAGTKSVVGSLTPNFVFKITGSMSGTVGSGSTVSVSVSPTSASVVNGGTQILTATVTGSTNTTVTWNTTGGTITPIPAVPTVRNSYFTATSNALSGISVVAGDLIIVAIAYGNSPITASCSDSASGGSNTYNAIGTTSPAFYDTSLNVFYAVAKNTETLAVTVTVGSTSYQGTQVTVVQGCVGSLASVLDTYAWGTVEGSPVSSHTTGSITTTAANDIMFTIASQNWAGGTGWSDSSGFTSLINAEFMSVGTEIAASAGAYSDTFSFPTATYAGSMLVAFKASGGGGNSALFTAPGTTGTYTVTAISNADTTKSASSVMTVTSGGNSVNSVTMSPTSLSVVEATTSATVTATVNYTGVEANTVNWTLSGGGTLTNVTGTTCTVLAGSSTGAWTLTATSTADGTKSASLTVTVTPSSGMSIAITSPAAPTAVGTGGTINCAATVTGNANTSVTWSVDGVASGNSTVGTITSGGVYTAPSTSAPTLHTITATSVANSAYTASTRVLATNGNTTYNAKTTYGATGNGSTDDTAAIQNCLTAAAGNIAYVPSGTYMMNDTLNISGTVALDVPANTCLYLAAGAVLKSITQSTSGQYRVVRLASNNSSVCGGEIIGDRVARNLPNNNTGQGGSGPNDFEVGDGIDINATSGNVVFGTNIHDCCCDGIYIYNQATNFMISDVTSNHNRRQGISVVGANTGTIQYCYATNTTGNDPACGIDMEPSGGGTVTYITVNYCTITGNAGGGIQLSAGSGSNGPSNTTITNNTITGNGGSDYGIGGIYADDSSSYGTISNNNCSSNIAGGDDGGIDLQNVSHFVVNNNTCNYNGGYGLYFSSTTSTTYHGNTLISNTSGTVGGDGSATAN